MTHYVLSLIGIIGAFYILKYRQQVGDMVGEADWMKSIGGIYNIIILVAILIFFWSIAELTNTTDVLFSPLRMLLPFFHTSQPSTI